MALSRPEPQAPQNEETQAPDTTQVVDREEAQAQGTQRPPEPHVEAERSPEAMPEQPPAAAQPQGQPEPAPEPQVEDRPEHHRAHNPDPAPRPQATAPAQAAPENQAVSQYGQTGGLPAQAGKVNANMDDLAEAGFEGLELNFTSFPTLKIEDGEIIDSQGTIYGKEVVGRILSTHSQWIYKNVGKDRPVAKDEEDFFYTKDQVTAIDGTPINDKLQKWQVNGWSHEIKRYVIALFELLYSDGNTEMFQLQIPPTSVGRLSGMIRVSQVSGRGLPRDYLAKVSVGRKVTTTAKPFYPFDFAYAGPLPEHMKI